MKLRFTPITLALLALLATPSAWAQSAADESATLPAPALKSVPQLTAPSSRRTSASEPSGETPPGAPLSARRRERRSGAVAVSY